MPQFLPSCPEFRLATLAVGWFRHLLFSWALPWIFSLSLPVLATGLRWLGFILGCPPSVASLRRLFPGSLQACWLALVELLCLWPPGFCGVPSLLVRSPVSGPVWVLPQSTIVTWLSLLWLGLLLVFVRFHCLWLTLWASACVGPHGCPAFSRVGAVPSTWVPLLWPG